MVEHSLGSTAGQLARLVHDAVAAAAGVLISTGELREGINFCIVCNFHPYFGVGWGFWGTLSWSALAQIGRD